MKMGLKHNNIEWIAALRGLLILFIFISHLSYLDINRMLLFVLGRIGVVGFFFVSGYLVYSSIAHRTCKQFVFNRFLRIYPVYWLLLIITYLFETYTLQDYYSFKEFLWNFTLFEEFVGIEKMIGTSWMLPIMIFSYLIFLCKKYMKLKITTLFYLSCLGSLIASFCRFFLDYPMPTAFGLLSGVSILGWMYKEKQGSSPCSIVYYLLLYNVVLAVSTYWSYADMASMYFLSYNLGLAIFFVFQKLNISSLILQKLSEIGFTFFLGAAIPLKIVEKHFMPQDGMNSYLLAFIQILLITILSYAITRYIEEPLLVWGKNVEKRL